MAVDFAWEFLQTVWEHSDTVPDVEVVANDIDMKVDVQGNTGESELHKKPEIAPIPEENIYDKIFGVSVKDPSVIEDKAKEMGSLDAAQADYQEYLLNELTRIDENLKEAIRELKDGIENGSIPNTAEMRNFLEALKDYELRLSEARWLLEKYDMETSELVYNVQVGPNPETDWATEHRAYDKQVLLSEAYWRLTGRVTIQIPDNVLGRPLRIAQA